LKNHSAYGLLLVAILQLESIYSTIRGLGQSSTIIVTVEAWCHIKGQSTVVCEDF